MGVKVVTRDEAIHIAKKRRPDPAIFAANQERERLARESRAARLNAIRVTAIPVTAIRAPGRLKMSSKWLPFKVLGLQDLSPILGIVSCE